ncbi:type IVB secretion system protein IcmH/DotU [Jannaschia sp. Os4]|uniref:type IVB secretion system protein IcmH/DotU n=1 Tax=Jannaschia sp. Os4 TaxID=2807617 RepID=UPI00193A9FB1|nr:type IVB secretion system protein IcmH/DotU [Jannaschia sp. Os4]MBM2578076.1 type IVB secretion system protein IcmH/DotU [Jannaschia sp. Os4]
MAGRDDRDKTVIGGPALGGGAGRRPDPFGRAPGGAGGDRTVIGGGPAPSSGARIGAGVAPEDSTWVGGPVAGRPAAPAPQAPPAGAAGSGPGFGTRLGAGMGPGAGGGIGRPAGSEGQGFFPEMTPREAQAAPRGAAPRITLEQAMRGTGLGAGGSSNPLVAAAANLLILFGRLRTGLVEMQAAPLMEHVYHEIVAFERAASAAGLPPQTVEVAKYALCGTADDIVQNLPGADRGQWAEYSMAARFFNTRDTGVGFFHEAEKAMQAPAEHYDLLELMLTCLSLGFEGEYRTRPNGATELARIRHAIYETLRRVKPRPDDDVSPMWAPVILRGRRRFGGIPVWAYAGLAAVLVVGFFATLSTLLNREGSEVANALYRMHPTDVSVALERSGPATPFVAPQAQLDRIRAALAPEIAAGEVEVGSKGDFIYVRVGNLLLFDSGRADLRAEFAPVAARIAEVLDAEPGPIRIEGFTDSVGQPQTNLNLSVARAEAVEAVIGPLLSDGARVESVGRGEADPIGDNATPEGRAQNRRVEVSIAREGTF